MPRQNSEHRSRAELLAVAGSRVVGEHLHPGQTERFTVPQGELAVLGYRVTYPQLWRSLVPSETERQLARAARPRAVRWPARGRLALGVPAQGSHHDPTERIGRASRRRLLR